MTQTATPSRPKPQFRPNIIVGGRGFDIDGMRRMATNEPDAFMAKVQRLIDEPDPTKRLRWNNIGDLRALWHGLSDVPVQVRFDVAGQQRAITASAFPVLSGALTVAGINDAYMAVPAIGQELVTDDDNPKMEATYVSILPQVPNQQRVDETQEFPEIGAGEEKYQIRSKRQGYRVSITAETIEQNDASDIVRRVNALGEIAAEDVEEQTLRRVCDIDGSATSPAEPYVLHLNGTGVALFQTDADPLSRLPSTGNRITNNALVDETDLEAARSRLAGMKNGRGKRITMPVSSMILLVPDNLAGTAAKLLNSELQPGVENEINNWGPRGRYRPRLLSSPKLDDLSTTVWYLGMPAKQFIRKWAFRFEFVTLGNDTESFLRNRIAFQARIAWNCEVGAVDYVYWVQNLSATTAP